MVATTAWSRVLLYLFVVVFGLSTWAASPWAQTLQIYHIDVEQGDATLFVAPNGNTLLVDSGKNGHGARIQAVMGIAGVTQIDHFVATHYHEDHYGSIDDLIETLGVRVVQAYDRGDKGFLPATKLNQQTYIDYQRAVGEDAIQLRRDMTIPLDPQLTVRCVAAGGVVIGEANPQTGIDENDMSVSLLIQFGAFSYFIGGDIHAPTEVKIAARNLVLDVDVYQANHHGSHTSSDPVFLADLMPRVAVISNGSHGLYHHPRQDTLTNLGNLTPAPTVFQTNKYLRGDDRGGNIPDEFIADPESIDSDGTILITVDLAAGSYTVGYGTTNHAFAIKGAATAPALVIENLLPNPVGDDRQLETVAVRNDGAATVPLAGWTLRDEAGRSWSLAGLGSITAGMSLTIQRSGQEMSLNNAGDQISLVDPQNVVRDQFRYTASSEGTIIQTGH